MTRLESAVRENNTLRELQLNPCTYRPYTYLFCLSSGPIPVPIAASVAEAMLKGAACNKRLEMMAITVPDTAELHKIVGEVKKVNKRLRLDVKYCKVRVSLC